MYRVVVTCNGCLREIATFYVEEAWQWQSMELAELSGGFLCESCEDRRRRGLPNEDVALFNALVEADDEPF